MRFNFDNGFRNSTTTHESGALIYIAGPISGDLESNLPRFFDAEWVLRARGHSTFNPARVDGGQSAAECMRIARTLAGVRTWQGYMRVGLRGLLRCNGIALLPGHERSAGARLEAHTARTLGFDEYDHATGDLLRVGKPQSKVPEDALEGVG